MTRKTVKIVSANGFHARPGTRFVKLAKTFQSEIVIKAGEVEANAKNLLRLMKIGICMGDVVEVICEGPDEEAAAASLSAFIAEMVD